MGKRLFIGLMSGTSVDGIDAALIQVTGSTGSGDCAVQVLGHWEAAWAPALRKRLLAVMAPAETSTAELCQLNMLVAVALAQATQGLLKQMGISAKKITAIGSHGQTVCHLPPRKMGGKGGALGSTLQLGDVSVLATLTGIKTVGNFRPADMALGGQGAPLVPWTDGVMLRDAERVRCVQNIGGIANVTYLTSKRDMRSGGKGAGILAFDTGPGNMLLDALVVLGTRGKQHYDKNARLARQGSLDSVLFAKLRRHPYFAIRPPKSTGREAFGADYAAKIYDEYFLQQRGTLADLLYTATYLTAWSMVDAYRRFLPRLPEEVILCGGGADNPLLVKMMEAELAAVAREMGAGVPRVCRIEELGIPNKAKEAASFALLAAATLDGVAGNVPGVTGARRGTVLGVIANPHKALSQNA